ncbi:MAG TPA: glycine-rich protein, partial [Oligoflexia bacterium]|nr:glycine-rich protein [Oligoflexia bacterium]
MIDDKELGEMGGVLFLAVFVVFLIMIALAFEIDFVRRMITEAQYKRTAAVVGLASLRTFRANAMAGEVSVSERQRIGRRAALEESRRVAALPGVASVFRPVSSLDFKIIPTEEVQGSVPSDAEGLISFGYWHFEPPAAGCSNSRQTKCPCPESQWLGPCFQPLRPNAKELPTAVQIELFTPEEKPLPMIFARFFGHQGSSIRVRAAVSLLSDAGILSTPRIVENVALPKRESLPEQESDSAEAEQADPSPLPTPALSPSPVPQITSTLKTPTPEETKRPCTARVLRYDKPGEYEIHIPHGCLIVKANVWGAGGASGSNTNKEPDSDGGGGGFVYGVIKLKQTDSLKLTVGSGGKSTCPQAYRQPAGFGGPGAA